MALNIRNDEAERLVAELARRTGESKTEAVIKAVRDRLARIRGGRSLIDELEAIAERCSRLPVRDARRPEDILGYGDDGLPG
jgi:antitoxin VapB